MYIDHHDVVGSDYSADYRIDAHGHGHLIHETRPPVTAVEHHVAAITTVPVKFVNPEKVEKAVKKEAKAIEKVEKHVEKRAEKEEKIEGDAFFARHYGVHHVVPVETHYEVHHAAPVETHYEVQHADPIETHYEVHQAAPVQTHYEVHSVAPAVTHYDVHHAGPVRTHHDDYYAGPHGDMYIDHHDVVGHDFSADYRIDAHGHRYSIHEDPIFADAKPAVKVDAHVTIAPKPVAKAVVVDTQPVVHTTEVHHVEPVVTHHADYYSGPIDVDHHYSVQTDYSAEYRIDGHGHGHLVHGETLDEKPFVKESQPVVLKPQAAGTPGHPSTVERRVIHDSEPGIIHDDWDHGYMVVPGEHAIHQKLGEQEIIHKEPHVAYHSNPHGDLVADHHDTYHKDLAEDFRLDPLPPKTVVEPTIYGD